MNSSRRRRRIGVAMLLACGIALLVPAASAGLAMANGHDPVPCGGWGHTEARTRADANNKGLRDVARQWANPREQPGGRWVVWKEECARMDLERDMYAFWRVMAVAAGGVFVVALSYVGISHMAESVTQGRSTNARKILINAVFGLLIVCFGLLIWQGVLVEMFGIATLEVGSFNPFGVPPR